MDYLRRASRFARDEDGAVTVDWVVLTAAIIGVTLAIFPIIIPAVNALASDISSRVAASPGSF